MAPFGRFMLVAALSVGLALPVSQPAYAGKKALIGIGIGIGVGILLNKALTDSKRRQHQAGRKKQRAPQSQVAQQMPKEDVLKLQKYLASQNYDVGTPDGVWGRKTTMALNAWQKSLGDVPGTSLSPRQKDLVFGGGTGAEPASTAASSSDGSVAAPKTASTVGPPESTSGDEAENDEAMEVQRCIWRCLAEADGADDPAYGKCVKAKC